MNTRRKILFVSSNFPPVIGGSSVVYDQLCRHAPDEILALGAKCDYRTRTAWPDLAAADASRNYMIRRLSYLRPPVATADPPSKLGRFAKLILRDAAIMARVIIHIAFLLARHRIKTVVLGELIYGGWLVLPLRYIFRRKVFIYTHGEEISQNADNLLSRHSGLFLHHAHGIIAVSLFCKGQIITKFHSDPAKIYVVGNGVDLETFRRGDKDRSVWPQSIRNRHIILSVSRLVEKKGQENLIRALPQIVGSDPNAHCVIVGSGPMENALRTLIAEIGMRDYCTILGSVPQDKLTQCFRSCDIFALPCMTLPDGDTEGFGLVFLEANACGKAVIAGIAGGTVEAVLDEETGLLVNGANPDEIAKAAIRLLRDEDFASRLADAGWRHAQTADWGSVTQRFLDICAMPKVEAPRPSYRPENDAFVHLPQNADRLSSKPQILVTVDVEEEFGWEEFNRDRHVVRGVEGLEKFHNDCRKIGLKPVYLTTYPILMDVNYRRFLKDVVSKNEAEAGIHIHSWTVPPYWEQANAFTSYQCNLPEHIERKKLKVLCKVFEECFGKKVFIHRAGRWGGGERTTKLLEELGIPVDLSPSVGYVDLPSGGPDFSNLDGMPFWSGPEKRVLAIPASSVNYLRGPSWLSTLAFRLTRKFPKLHLKTLKRGKPVRFSPENADEATLAAMAHELGLRQLPVAVYTLHSTSLYPGGNPYSVEEGHAEALHRRSFEFLSMAISKGILQPTTCAELYAEARASTAIEDLEMPREPAYA